MTKKKKSIISQPNHNPLVCELCGSEDVQTKTWVNVNTYEIGGDASEGEEEDNWCLDCQEHCKIIDQSEYIDNILSEEQ